MLSWGDEKKIALFFECFSVFVVPIICRTGFVLNGGPGLGLAGGRVLGDSSRVWKEGAEGFLLSDTAEKCNQKIGEACMSLLRRREDGVPPKKRGFEGLFVPI